MTATQTDAAVPIEPTTAHDTSRARTAKRRRWDVPALSWDDIEARLAERRAQIRGLRRLVSRLDLVVAALVVLALALAGHPAGGGAALLVVLGTLVKVHDADAPRAIRASGPVFKAVLVGSVVGCVAAAFTGALFTPYDVLLGAAATGLGMLVVRAVLHLPAPARRLGMDRRRRLVVGDPQDLESNAARRQQHVSSEDVVPVATRAERPQDEPTEDPGQVAWEQRHQTDDPTGPRGMVRRIVRTALENRVERVTVIPGETWGHQPLRELSWLLEGSGIEMVIETYLDGIAPHRVEAVSQDGRLNIKLGSAAPRGVQALVKEVVDRAGALFLLVLLAPVLTAIGLAIRTTSAGPALFRQTRVRAGGVPFTMIKFRTMRTDAESHLEELRAKSIHEDSLLFKMTDDPRITKVGKLLRRTSLDELPQLINVLRGEMSLIGPRPALPVEVAAYDYVARRRLAVKPGMTGLWQVSGRSRLSWDESIGFDLEYVDNWSPVADAAIAVRTFRAVVKQDGAY